MTKLKYIICILILSLTNVLNAQVNQSSLSGNDEEQCPYCKKGSHQHSSPYVINFKKEIPYFATGLGLLASGVIFRSLNEEAPFTIGELDNLDRANINRFDRGATRNSSGKASLISDVILYSSAALPLYFLSNHHTKKDFLPLIVMSAEIYAITGGLVLNSKFLFNRSRPLTYNSEFSVEERTNSTSKLSFFSGHTSQTASFSIFAAKVLTDYHPNMKKGLKIGIWAFALGLPATIGYLRVQGGHHFNSDVLTGYAVGAAVGWLVPHLHKARKDAKLSITPFNYGRTTGINLSWKID